MRVAGAGRFREVKIDIAGALLVIVLADRAGHGGGGGGSKGHDDGEEVDHDVLI